MLKQSNIVRIYSHIYPFYMTDHAMTDLRYAGNRLWYGTQRDLFTNECKAWHHTMLLWL